MREDKKVIGICVASMQSDSWEKHVKAICQDAKKRGYSVLIFNTFQRLDTTTKYAIRETKIFEMIPYEKLGALIIFTQSILNEEISDALAGRAKAAGVPVISIDRRLEECNNVLFAYEKSFEEIVRHVVETHGCKCINFMAGFENNDFSDARIASFKKVLAENNIEFEEDRLAYGQFWELPARRFCEEWVAKWKNGEQTMPEAVICANDMMALTVMNVLTNHGIKIPEDVIVTGFDGLELEQYCTPRLTTATDDVAQIGRCVLELVDFCRENPDASPKELYIPFHPRFTESCGCRPIMNCNPNERIMYLYGYAAEMRQQSTETFFMMTTLTDGYSAVEMANKLKKYKKSIDAKSMMLFLNRSFYDVTDIPSSDFSQDSYVLLSQIKAGKYSVPLEEVHPENLLEKIQWMEDAKDPLLYIPIHCQEEHYGVMVTSYDYTGKDTRAFYEFVLALEQVLGTIRRQSQLHRSYITDVLTNLYNRRGFYIKLEKKIKHLTGRKRYLFLASVDMDGLKYINDTYGHAEGDYAIKQLSRILQSVVKNKQGICARFGGDEYMVALITEEKEADYEFYKNFNNIFQKRIERYNRRSKREYMLSASSGTVGRVIQGTGEIDKLMKEADNLMYQCKCQHHESRESRLRGISE